MGLNGKIDLMPTQHRLLVELIERHLPNTDVWAYGSRVQWNSRPESDLDLVVFSGPDQDGHVAALREALEESGLPFRVDLLVWDKLPESFRETIADEHVDFLTRCHYPNVPIGEIAEIVGGGTPSTRDPANFGGTVPWLTPRDLSKPHHPNVSRGARNLSRQGLKSSSASLVPKGAVLLSTRAPVGYTAIAGCPLTTNQGFRSLIPGNRITSHYLYYWLTANVSELRRHATGSTFAELSGRALKSICIPLPPVAVQRELTQALEALDAKIAMQRRMAATLESIMLAVFGDCFRSRTTCHVDQMFRQGSVGQYYRITMGQSPPGDSYNDKGNGQPFLQGSADFGFRFPKIRKYCTNPTRLVSRDETLVSVRAPVGAVNMAGETLCIGRGLVGIVHKSGARSYTYYAIKVMQATFRQYDQDGTVFGSITKKQLEDLPVQEPPRQLIKAFESIAVSFDAHIRSIATESRILTHIRDSLSSEMFAGGKGCRIRRLGSTMARGT